MSRGEKMGGMEKNSQYCKALPIFPTPMYAISSRAGNQIYVKREDLLPFSFGGNKVRFVQAYLEDMEQGGYSGMVIYGNYHSNLCRIFAAACKRKGIPCSMVHNIEDEDGDAGGVNARLIRAMDVKEFPCHKNDISDAVERAIEDLRNRNVNPYYMYGDCDGKGREWIPIQAYVDVYREIRRQEKELGICFDYIFLAASTESTISGLVAGCLLEKDDRRIVGISVNRKKERACEVMEENLRAYEKWAGVCFRTDLSKIYEITDKYLGQGYGIASKEIREAIREVYEQDGIPLDETYTGKAFWGMTQYLKAQGIKDKNTLFLHTGGLPLFFEGVPKIFTAEEMETHKC